MNVSRAARARRRAGWLRWAGTLALGAIAGGAVASQVRPGGSSLTERAQPVPEPLGALQVTREPSGRYRYIRPLLRVEVAADDGSPELRTLVEALRSQIAEEQRARRVTDVGVYFRELDTLRWIGVHDEDRFVGSSLLKVPLMVAWLQQAETRPELLRQLIELPCTDGSKRSPEHRLGPAPRARQRLLRRRARAPHDPCLRQRERAAAPRPRGALGPRRRACVRRPRRHPHTDERGLGSISPREYARTFRALYSATYLGRAMSEHALELLAQTQFHEGLVAGVPAGTRVAHKFGERTLASGGGSSDGASGGVTEASDGADALSGVRRELHDCGIVYHALTPYLLCVMTRGRDYGELSTVIAHLSRRVYEEVERREPSTR